MVAMRFVGFACVAVACLASGCEPKPAAGGQPSAAASSAVPSLTASVPARPRTPEWERLAASWVYPNPIPNFELTNHEGQAFRLRDIGDGYLLVGLIFTSCSVATACPLTTQKMFEVGKLWKKAEAEGKTGDKKLRLLTLTFDPETDTPEVLKSYGEVMLREIPTWTFATGPVELMEETLPKMFGVLATDDPKAGKAHNVKAALLGPGLQAREEWKDNSFEPQAIIELVLR